MKMIVGSDYLLEGVAFKLAADIGGNINPRLIVMHYTGGAGAPGSVRWLTEKDDVYVSAHIVIARDGEVTQLAPFNRKCGHAGASKWRGKDWCNSYSVGIELANRGQLVEHGGKIHVRNPDGSRGKEFTGQSIKAAHKNGSPACHWEAFPNAQLKSAADVCCALISKYPVIDERRATDLPDEPGPCPGFAIAGHDDISPGRKVDPGPAFDWGVFWTLLVIRLSIQAGD